MATKMTELQEFIKECDCEVIQKQRQCKLEHGKNLPYVDGDWVYDGSEIILIGGDGTGVDYYEQYNGKLSISNDGYSEGDGYEVDKVTWLPTTQQLIDMLEDMFGKVGRDVDKKGHVDYYCVARNHYAWKYYTGKSPRLALVRAVKEVLK